MTTIFFCKGGIIETSSVTIASLLTTAGTAITSGIGIVWNIATANPLLTFFVGASVIGVAFGMFRKAKRSVR